MGTDKDDKDMGVKPTPYEKSREHALRLSRDIGRHMIYGGIGKTIKDVRSEMPPESETPPDKGRGRSRLERL